MDRVVTIPKKFEETRDELAREFNSKEYGSKIDFKKGFNSALYLLLPEIKKLEEALMHSKVGFYSVSFVTDSSDLKMNMINLGIHCKSQENKIDQALQSLSEFLGSEE